MAFSSVFPWSLMAGESAAPRVTSAVAPASDKIRDTALDKDGLLKGKVVDRQGQPLNGSPVVIFQGTRELARTATNANGDFAFRLNRGGMLQLATYDDAVLCRVWSQQAAPPSAQQGILLCSGELSVRGQCNCHCAPACPGGKPAPAVSVEQLRALAPDLPEGQFAAFMRADVVITNPDHYSVVIAYDPATGNAFVVAKGVDALALQIQQAARAASIPIVQNPPLARALYEQVAVGGAVPANLLGQVTNIINSLTPPAPPAQPGFQPGPAPGPAGGLSSIGLAGLGILAVAVIVPVVVVSHNDDDDTAS